MEEERLGERYWDGLPGGSGLDMEVGTEARLLVHRGSTCETGSGTDWSHESLWKRREISDETSGSDDRHECVRGFSDERLSFSLPPSDGPVLPETDARTLLHSWAAGTRAPTRVGRTLRGRRRRSRCGNHRRPLGSSCR